MAKNSNQAGNIDHKQLQECINLMGDDVRGIRLYQQRNATRPLGNDYRTLYHFTCEHWLPQILNQGLTKGDVPISTTGGFDAPWLTKDSFPHRIGVMGPNEIGTSSAVDKTRFRMTVKIPCGDRNLWRWTELAKALKVQKSHLEKLNASAQGGGKSWYVYLGVIPPEWIMKLEKWNGSEFCYIEKDTFL